MQCKACHIDLKHYRDTPMDCHACHKKDDKHEGQLGQKCENCHSDRDWKVARFDHSPTRFPLLGKHAPVKCADCHKTLRYKDAPRDCYGCHKKDDKHKLTFGVACESCHNARAWGIWDYDHTRRAKYQLDGAHAKLACETCHTRPAPAGKPSAEVGNTCLSCHRRDDKHDGAFGSVCEQCHSTDNWKRIRNRVGMSPGRSDGVGERARCFQPPEPRHRTRVASMNGLSSMQAAYRRARAALALLLWLFLSLGTQGALAQGAGQKNFDHLKTGFALTGKHLQTSCESCHQNGIFKGTPRECALCHVSGMRSARGNVVMPQQHLPTRLTCSSCHNTETFIGAKFNHAGVAPGSCQSCHSSGLSTSKPASHIQTTASCDTCHRTNAWSPAANFDHTGVVPGTCTSCHGAGRATAKAAQHMPTNANQSCDDCHKSFSTWRPTAWSHTQMLVNGQCASCHSGGYPPADGRPANHVPYASIASMASANCDACHKGSFSSWANGRVHANFSVTGNCASCHSGAFLNAVGKPNNTIHTGATTCESCHNASGWAGAKVDHGTFTAATNCANCHNGTTAATKPAAHIPTGSTSCFACHNVSPALWTPTKWNHTQVPVTAACASCHTGGYPPADGKPNNHIPHQTVAVSAAANCDACHKGSTTTWANGGFHINYSVATGCASCHSGAYLNAVGKPNNTIHNGATHLRKLPQHEQLGRRQGRSQHVHDRNQLRQLPQRHDSRRQAGQPHSDHGQLLRLPQRQPRGLEANQVDTRASRGDRAMCQLPHRRLSARRWPAGQPHPVPDRRHHRCRQLRQLPPRQLHHLGAMAASTPITRWPPAAPPATRAPTSTRSASPATPPTPR